MAHFMKLCKMLQLLQILLYKLMVCHDDTRLVIPLGCSGIFGPRSHVGACGPFYEILQNAFPLTNSLVQ